jgi:hypothetical protein
MAKILHDKDVPPHFDGRRTLDSSSMHPPEVPHLLLSPEAHHLARVRARIARAKAEFSRNVSVAVFEDEDGGLVYFESEVRG